MKDREVARTQIKLTGRLSSWRDLRALFFAKLLIARFVNAALAVQASPARPSVWVFQVAFVEPAQKEVVRCIANLDVGKEGIKLPDFVFQPESFPTRSNSIRTPLCLWPSL